MANWIKCSERMPDDGQSVYYFFSWVGVWAGKFEVPNVFYCDAGVLCGDVTHWMPRDEDCVQPLPEPPQE